MNAQELIKKLNDLDVKIWADGDKIKWDAPSGVIKDELWAEMKEHKTEILALLKDKENGSSKAAEVSIPTPKVVKRGRGKGDFPHVYRPCRISEFYGQDEIKKIIAYGLNTGTLAQVLSFQGVSGTGKTTMGRIVAMGLNCENGPTSEPCLECNSCKSVLSGCSLAYLEYDAAHLSGVNSIRTARDDFPAAPMTGERSRIVLFDECHNLSYEAQGALLKPAEDVWSHLYLIFCSTKEFLETLQYRCQQFKFNALSNDEIRMLLFDVCASEKFDPDTALLENIIKEAKGMPRNALFLLQKAVALRTSRPVSSQVSEDT
jgi:DNA polymerase-3 subunit gamma/tau